MCNDCSLNRARIPTETKAVRVCDPCLVQIKRGGGVVAQPNDGSVEVLNPLSSSLLSERVKDGEEEVEVVVVDEEDEDEEDEEDEEDVVEFVVTRMRDEAEEIMVEGAEEKELVASVTAGEERTEPCDANVDVSESCEDLLSKKNLSVEEVERVEKMMRTMSTTTDTNVNVTTKEETEMASVADQEGESKLTDQDYARQRTRKKFGGMSMYKGNGALNSKKKKRKTGRKSKIKMGRMSSSVAFSQASISLLSIPCDGESIL